MPYRCILLVIRIYGNIQGDFFDWSPLNLAESQIPCKLAQNFSECQRLKRDFVLRKFRGDQSKKSPCIA